MTIDDKLREAADAVRSAREDAVFTVGVPTAGSGPAGPGSAWIVGFAILLVIGVPAYIAVTGSGAVGTGPVLAPVVPTSYPGLSEYLASVPESQRILLADGLVTFADLEAAVDRTLQCISGAGFDKVHGSVDPRGGSTFGIVWGRQKPATSVEDDFWRAVELCQEEHFNRVDFMYGWTHSSPWHDDYQPEVSARIAMCVSLQIPTSRSGYADWESALQALGEDVFDICEKAVLGP